MVVLHQSDKEIAQVLGPLHERGWLASQPVALQRWMADNGRWRNCAAGEVLYLAGDEPDALYGLGSGALEMTLPLVNDEPVAVHRAEPGFWIGDSAILAATTRMVTVTAARPGRIFRVPGAAVRVLLADRPEFWPAFFALNHHNTDRAVTALAEALSLTPRARLARMLLRLAAADGTVDATQSDLARLIGMNRSSLQRAVQDLVDIGAIGTGYGSLRVLDRAGLGALVQEA